MTADRRGAGRSAERADDRVLSQAASEAVLERLRRFSRAPEWLPHPEVASWCSTELRWGRNRTTVASDRRDVRVSLGDPAHFHALGMTTNQLDDTSLANLVRANPLRNFEGSDSTPRFIPPPLPPLPLPQPAIWSEATYNVTPEALGAVARGLIEPAEAQGLLSAGYLELRAMTQLRIVNGVPLYARYTQAQCSMTVRDP